jgi:excisionase family DNA binding protein
MEQELFKVKSTMEKLKVSRATVYRLVERGQLDLVKIGAASRITSASIDRLIATKGKN